MNFSDLLSAARTHWRVTLLIVLMVVSLFVLFAPLGGLQPDQPGENGAIDGEEEAFVQEEGAAGLTNLQWGLRLSGGSSVRAPLIGFLVEDLAIEPEETGDIEVEIATMLDVDEADVTVRAGEQVGDGSIETTDADVERTEFLAAVQEAGFSVSDDDIIRGVHSETREQTRDVLEQKVNTAGLSGATVTISTRPTGEHLMVVEVPNIGQDQLLELIGDRGQIEVQAHFPDEDGEYQNVTVLREGDFASIDPAQPGDAGQLPYVPVRIESTVAAEFQATMNEHGFSREGGTICTWEAPAERPDDPGHCLVTKVDGEVVYAGGVSANLADSFRNEEFELSPDFRMQTTEFEDAQTLSINLRAGSLPAELDFAEGTMFFVEPSLAEDFRLFSLIVGIFAALAVAGMIYWRYRDARVAAPMLVTASAEVIILLALAVIVPIPLDLAHIAGFIAVLGTGVDDLVIIADEIMQRGEIRTGRVFESRFRKAFWVIGVAAATTILAMTPLVALSLGDLTGFAIVTILGVMIGVGITRPAYGNILRILLLD